MATSLTLQNDASLAQGYVKVNGTTSATFTTAGLSTPEATIGSITGILKASSGVVSQAVAGTDYLTVGSGGTITLATAQAASGNAAVDFTGIPSWVKRITVMFANVSSSSTSDWQILLGDSGGIEISGYASMVSRIGGTGAVNDTLTTGFLISNSIAAAANYSAIAQITLINLATNTWSIFGSSNSADTTNSSCLFNGTKSTSTTLDRIRITTVGTDTFDAGTINISYE